MTEQQTISTETTPDRIIFFPITLFGAIMGYAGLTIGFHNAHTILGMSQTVALALTAITTLFFIMVALAYGVKLLKYKDAVTKEINHPIAVNFFPTASISLLLLSVLYKDIAPTLSEGMFIIGALAQLVLTFYVVQSWILHEKWQINQMTPAWFIPVVGNIVAPLPAMQFGFHEIAWFYFSIGLVFWLILLAIVMYRLFFHPPMLRLMEPTLFILIAPPAMGFLSYLAIQHGDSIDNFGRVLYYTALFFALLLFTQIWRFIKVPFSLSWWAYTFPIATIANASFMMYEKLHMNAFGFFAAFFLSVLSALVLHLTLKTFIAIKNKKLCIPPPAEPKQVEPSETEQNQG
ncbi:SLAC1 anion channel family protein [Hydrogenovibrio marinus]|uniref:SLAC1 anion channel family protein n=1 Tax=Hydrogenovibrio marinus TaxID=28885 RepID=UPI00068B0392|nr:SLAC1 anion channel family protein [Hydrogenovibrio marinus]